MTNFRETMLLPTLKRPDFVKKILKPMQIQSRSGSGSGSNIRCNPKVKKVKINNNEIITFLETILLLILKRLRIS
jgi:hypothetical protein